MTQIITDGRFTGEPKNYTPLSDITDWDGFEGNVELTSDTHPDDVIPNLHKISGVRVLFPTSADGRGNSIAKALRMAGFAGPIRAAGHILADQYPLVLRSGFDDVEIDVTLAQRQPEAHWVDSLTRLQNNYLERLNFVSTPIKYVA